MATSHRSPSIDLASANAASASQPRKSTPSRPENIQDTDSSSVAHSTSSSTRPSRSQSLTSRNGKRLSLSFPVQPHGNNYIRHTPSSSTSATPITPFIPTPIGRSMFSPEDTGSFLVALAAHERRVLELREELNRAEKDLHMLKRQWEMHEATKKLHSLRNGEPLRPLNTVFSQTDSGFDERNAAARLSKEYERRKMSA